MDIERAKKLANKLNWSHFDMSEDSSKEYIEAIETVLEELENKQDDINILQAQRDSMEYQFKQAKLELEKKDTIIKYLIDDLYDLAVAINEEYRVEEYLLNKETIKEYYLNRKEE